MTSKFLLLSICALFVAPLRADEPATEQQVSEVVQVDIKQLSETFGNFVGKNLKMPGFEFDLESLIQGIRAGAAGQAAPLSDEEYEEGMAYLQEEVFSKVSKENLEMAESFLNKNVAAEGVAALEENKLQYTVVEAGQGAEVTADMSPQISYTGRLLDGEVFGSSEESGPIVLSLAHTIPGFRKGIEGMKEGEKRTLYIHPDLGYGVTGQLPPNSLLIFDVQVLKADSPKEDPFAYDGEADVDFDDEIAFDHTKE